MKIKIIPSIFFSAGLLLLLTVVLYSCKKDKVVTPDQELALFGAGGTTTSYLVTENPNATFKIGLGVTKPASVDRKINFSITSPTGAVEGTQYTISSKTVTIPAGKVVDSVSLKGIFAGFPTGRRDTLVFKITGGDIPSLIGSDEYKVVLQKFCPLNVADLSGNYVVLADAFEDTSPGDIIAITKISDTKFSFIYPSAANAVPIVVTISPANNSLDIPVQTIGTEWIWNTSYKNPSVKATGTFIPCDKVINLNMTWGINGGAAVFNGGPFRFSLVKQ